MSRIPSKVSLEALACSGAFVVACGGGGGGTASTPALAPAPAPDTGSATMAGTVTGFGSLIFDGIRIDNHAALALTCLEDGSTAPIELKLGQHVEVQHDAQMVATSVKVVAEAEGPVNAAGGALTVLGQAITINADPKSAAISI